MESEICVLQTKLDSHQQLHSVRDNHGTLGRFSEAHMVNVRLSMRRTVEVLRLYHDGGRSHREIARVVSISPTTVGEILRRAKQCGITCPLPAGMSEMWLEAQLYPPVAPSSLTRPEPDWQLWSTCKNALDKSQGADVLKIEEEVNKTVAANPHECLICVLLRSRELVRHQAVVSCGFPAYFCRHNWRLLSIYGKDAPARSMLPLETFTFQERCAGHLMISI